MDRIKVELITQPNLKAALLAVGKPYKKDGTIDLLHKVAKHFKHESVLEHINFSWNIDGSSRLELQEHMRHRIASPTVQSTRYTLKEMFDELPSVIDYESLAFFINKWCCLPLTLKEDKNAHEALYSLIFSASCAKKLYGNDTAKYLLPECLRTSFVWTLNLRSMLNFLKLRKAPAAHFEIRHIATEMARILSETDVKTLLEE